MDLIYFQKLYQFSDNIKVPFLLSLGNSSFKKNHISKNAFNQYCEYYEFSIGYVLNFYNHLVLKNKYFI